MTTSPRSATELLRALIQAPNVAARDIDDSGRLLVGCDAPGSAQLYEVDGDGAMRRLTDLDGPANGRYLPHSRTVVVEHDAGGNERAQLSLLDVESGPGTSTGPGSGDGESAALPPLRPLVHDPRWIHRLAAVQPGRVLYLTNRRNGVDFDLVSRDVQSGEEQVLYDGGGYVLESEASPDGRWVALTRPNAPANSVQLLLISTADGAIEELTPWGDDAFLRTPSWLPDSSSFVVSTNSGREMTAVMRYDLATRTWTDLVVDKAHDLIGWASPDGEHLLISTNDDGAISAAVHRLADGAHVSDIGMPAGGCVALPVWSGSGRWVALTFTSPVEPLYAARFDLDSQSVTTVRAPGAPALPDGDGHAHLAPRTHTGR